MKTWAQPMTGNESDCNESSQNWLDDLLLDLPRSCMPGACATLCILILDESKAKGIVHVEDRCQTC